jgi:hypothetical protein
MSRFDDPILFICAYSLSVGLLTGGIGLIIQSPMLLVFSYTGIVISAFAAGISLSK